MGFREEDQPTGMADFQVRAAGTAFNPPLTSILKWIVHSTWTGSHVRVLTTQATHRVLDLAPRPGALSMGWLREVIQGGEVGMPSLNTKHGAAFALT